MGIVNNMLDKLAQRIGYVIQGEQPTQRYRDNHNKAEGYSVESEISETLADLMLMSSSMPISGDTERAKWMDAVADTLFQRKMKSAVTACFLTGDCVIVPSWNGRSIQNLIIDSDSFEVLECVGDEITAIAYVVDVVEDEKDTYTLMQAIELVRYTDQTGTERSANRYRMYVVRNGGTEVELSQFPHWAERYDESWYVPNVDRLLIGRLRSNTVNTDEPNAIKGAPICFGASDPIEEIHYLLDQMHNEFGLSEKMIIADKRMFKREIVGNDVYTVLPKGRERVFCDVGGTSNDLGITEWSPDIRYQSYMEALDKQEQLVERAVGVSAGIISKANDQYYQNVDNVRKSQQKTMGFIDAARRMAENCLTDLVYAWETLANYYGIVPMGAYDVSFDWSDEYIETFADKQTALLAGVSIGATDAVDYRMFVMDESPEAARQRVEEIAAAKQATAMLNEPMTIEEV